MSQPLFRPSPIPTRRHPKSLVRFSEKRDQSVIARHIRNIYKEEELEEEGTYAKFAYMGHDGLQLYEVTHYNLDVIISVGYRVKSKRGTKFRQWAFVLNDDKCVFIVLLSS